MHIQKFRHLLFAAVLLSFTLPSSAQEQGLRGDPVAIADAQAMVETMGGATIWKTLASVHFVHEWDIINRPDIYLENEILDLTGPRSYVTMESEIYSRIRAYSPENRYWNIVNGEFSYASDESFNRTQERAPYSIYRLARAVARGDSHLTIRYGSVKSIPQAQALEFVGPDGEPHGWILLNVRNEPIIWATTQYEYVFGPLKRFGNLRVPDWATTGGGAVRYQMVSLVGSNKKPDASLFVPPAEYAEK